MRVRTKDGQLRCTVQPSDDISVLVSQVLTATKAEPSTLTFSDTPQGQGQFVSTWQGQSLSSLGIKHGDLLFASYKDAASHEEGALVASGKSSATENAAASGGNTKQPAAVNEDPVDQYWAKERGLIKRPHDPQFCRHGAKGMCDYCMPIEPFDMAFHAEHGIKHLSFHAYLRHQNIGVPSSSASSSSSTYVPPLEEVSYRVKTPCPSGHHAPWPAGICTKCQPSAITLQRQPYRMVDHVEFVHSSLIDHVLDIWRKTATQRFGFLLGHYEPYEKVPMGIKAVIEAIHEPPQAGEIDGIELGLPWDDETRITSLAAQCGMSIVGMIYTDLEVADPSHTDASLAGLVACKRHADSFFLSGQEAIFAAQLQAQHKNACRWTESGSFNSKFVTCVLSGNPEGDIDVSAYQVSEQVMGMVDADMIEASVHPTTIRVKPNDESRYVPDVFFRYTNKYGIDIKENASPTFPVEYLLVTCTHGFPTEPKPRFLSSTFPIENRPGLQDQTLELVLHDLRTLLTHPDGTFDEDMHHLDHARFVRWLSDWHLLAFLDHTSLLSHDEMRHACRTAVSHDDVQALTALLTSPGWRTLVALARETAPPPSSPPSAGTSARDSSSAAAGTDPAPTDSIVDAPTVSADAGVSSSAADGVACPHCTFLNAPGSTDCDVCGLPL